ncbi:hypothetical protein FRC17_011186 [Serendipita sp. 399]|nr:hypothetical protein FRC17_011186 [Serendipita sp. 399]
MPPLGYHVYRLNADYEISRRWQEHPLKGELDKIREEVPNESLANLFTRTVKRLVEKKKQSSELEQIVLSVRDRILAVDDGDESFQQCRQILREGISGVKPLVGQGILGRLSLDKLAREEEKALEEDEGRHERVQLHSQPSSNANTEVQIFFMGEPDRGPYLLRKDPVTTTYNHIIWHLRFHGIVKAPQLWIRREDPNVQPYTSSGRHWVFAIGHVPINEMVLDTVEMANVPDYYIVALVDDGETELPSPVGVPIFGKAPCCDLSCGSLSAHLEAIWAVRVEQARLFRDRNDVCVLNAAFNSMQFPSQTNELYVKVVRQMDVDQEPSSSAIIETPVQ